MENDVISTMLAAKKIYSYLCDDESRLIFRNKWLFSVVDAVEQNICMHNICETMYPQRYSRLKEVCTSDNDLVVYGAGNYCASVIDLCRSYGGNVVCLCDSDLSKSGMIGPRGLEIITPDCLTREHANAYIIIATLTAHREVKAYLDNIFDSDKVLEFAIDIEEEIISEQYFDADIVKYENEEIFVDCGSFDFQTSLYLSERCNVKKVFAFEPDEANVVKINENVKDCSIGSVEVFNKGVWNKEERLSFCVGGTTTSYVVDKATDQTVYLDVVALDDVIDEKVTFIKMDIEGSELKALEGAKRLIQTYKPKLAISVYHKPEDLITLPQYILSLVPEYKLYLRHYSNFDHETVLYAVL